MRLLRWTLLIGLVASCGDDSTSYAPTGDVGTDTGSDSGTEPVGVLGCESAPCIGGSFSVDEVANETGAFDALVGTDVEIRLAVDASQIGDEQPFPETSTRLHVVFVSLSSDPPELAALMGGPDAELHGQMLVRGGDVPLLTIFAARPIGVEPPMNIEIICQDHRLPTGEDGLPQFGDVECDGSFGMRRFDDRTSGPTDAIGGVGRVHFSFE